jgi:hypothetical protein
MILNKTLLAIVKHYVLNLLEVSALRVELYLLAQEKILPLERFLKNERSMRNLILLFIVQLFLTSGLFAQKEEIRRPGANFNRVDAEMNKDSNVVYEKGEITYVQEERISILDEYMKAHPLKHDGYRVQLVFGSREEVSNAKSRFLVRWEHRAYESYLQPNFRLRIGDFMSRFEAERILAELKPHFPGAYIVPDKIEVPKAFR